MPVTIAIIIADITMRTALRPKKPKRRMVMGRFAQGDDKRKAITLEVFAPFLYSSIEIAKIPWEHALIRKPRRMEYRMVLF